MASGRDPDRTRTPNRRCGRPWCIAVALLLTLWGPWAAPAVGETRYQSPPTARASATDSRVTLSEQQLPAPLPLPDAQELEDLYHQMNAAWNAQDWPTVLDLIQRISAIDPDYKDTSERRYFAYVNHGFALMTQARCTEALSAYRQAIALRPDGEEALSGLELMDRYCPSVVPEPTPGPTGPIQYTVQRGDTLFSLARRYGTTVRAIMQANGMTGHLLRAGETICIPVGGAPPAGPLVHIVQPGETLFSIAKLYNSTVQAIVQANGLTSYVIPAYRALYVPSAMQPGGVIHIVARGETLFSIARRYGTTVALLMAENHLASEQIIVYQRLVIPASSAGPGTWPPSTYTVQRGDTLFGIARQFGTTVAALKAANGITSDDIAAGTVLRIR